VTTPGQGIDSEGRPVIDPTQNVLDLVQAAIQRQDDLRSMADTHAVYVAELRADYDRRLREAETARIDAIRAVDVGAVQRAAEVSITTASTLAAQVAASAETLRAQVAAAATATATNLATALEPMQRAIDDLRRAQYEQAGVRTQVVEQRAGAGEARLNLGAAFGGLALLVSIIGVIVLLTR